MPYRQAHRLGDERNGDLEDDFTVESRPVRHPLSIFSEFVIKRELNLP
jgi:hypothetical protein